MEKNTSDRQSRKALLESYKQIKTVMGIIRVTNTHNGKSYIAAYPNLKNKWYTIQSQLNIGRHVNAGLQQDWKQSGSAAFTYEVLEEKTTDKVDDVRLEMKRMEKRWMEKLQPYGEKGYHKPPQ